MSVDSAKRKITVDKTMSTVFTAFNHSMPTKCAINAQSCVIKPSVYFKKVQMMYVFVSFIMSISIYLRKIIYFI